MEPAYQKIEQESTADLTPFRGHGKLARLDQLQTFQYKQWFALDNVNADIRIQHVYQNGSLSCTEG